MPLAAATVFLAKFMQNVKRPTIRHKSCNSVPSSRLMSSNSSACVFQVSDTIQNQLLEFNRTMPTMSF